MAFIYKSLIKNLGNLIPLILLYFLSFSEIDTHFSNMFEILSFNIQLIIIYYWVLKKIYSSRQWPYLSGGNN